jgi:hypothetical protein
MKTFFKVLGILACVLYLLNPGAGFVELLPDNLPLIGNLDEGAAGAMLILLLQSFRKKSDLPRPPPPPVR